MTDRNKSILSDVMFFSFISFHFTNTYIMLLIFQVMLSAL